MCMRVTDCNRINYSDLDIASAWVIAGRLARKGGFMTTAFNSVLHAEQLGDGAAKIEYSKLLWKEGHHRKAIAVLRGAIDGNAFQNSDSLPINIGLLAISALLGLGLVRRKRA